MDQTQVTSSNRTAFPTQASEIVAEVDPADQADNRARPFCRRALIIARPPRVRMRLRKPCFRARLRVFGWYVRFIQRLLWPCRASSRGGAPRFHRLVISNRSPALGRENRQMPSVTTARPTWLLAWMPYPSLPPGASTDRDPNVRLRAFQVIHQPIPFFSMNLEGRQPVLST